MINLDILDVYQRSFIGGKVSVWNRCVTCKSNVCSEWIFENLVEKILDQLQKKKSMTFEISECLGSQYYHSLLNFSLLKYVVLRLLSDSIM